MRRLLIAALAACSSPSKPAPTAPAQPPPATPPPATAQTEKVLKFDFITVGRPAGEGEIRIQSPTQRTTHFTFNDRGRGPDVRTEMTTDAAGLPRTFRAKGHDYFKAPVDEQLDSQGGKLAWRSTGEKGEAASDAGYYVASNDFDATLTRALLRAKDHRLKLLPDGEAWLQEDVVVEIDVAGTKRQLHHIAIGGLGFQPQTGWYDEDYESFANVSPWSSVIRTGAAAAIPALLAYDNAWEAKQAAKLAELAHKPPAAGLAITHARVFDSEKRVVQPDRTVVIVGDRITAVGDARTKIPAGAQVIDAQGKMLIPGLWDMHVHSSGVDGVLQIATGVTTVRDMGNDIDDLSARMKRYDGGTEIGPHVLRAGLIDGPGKFAAPTGVLADNPEDAIKAVNRFADLGYQQIKMYSSLKPELVPVIAKAAHARHLRVSGHVPNGMNAAQVVEGGYDEIQHVNMLFLRFLGQPEDDIRTPARFTRVAEGGAGLDLNGPDVKKFLDLLVAHKTVLDPTLGTFHAMFVNDPSDIDPILVPYQGRLPAQVQRGAKGGGLPAEGDKRALYRKSYAAMLGMVKHAWDRKIPIVAGTDAIAGLSLPHELELYVQAGIPAPDVLSLATIGAARVMGLAKQTGSIAVGKQADLALIDGDPTRDIAAVRKARTVVCRGVVYDPAELFPAIGMKP